MFITKSLQKLYIYKGLFLRYIMETKKIIYKVITKSDYQIIKSEFKQYGLSKIATIKQCNAQHMIGSISISPRKNKEGEYEFSNEQIDKICKWLSNRNIGLDEVLDESVYGEEHGKFAGTKLRHLKFRKEFMYMKMVDKIIK